jgi:hypothetical protein
MVKQTRPLENGTCLLLNEDMAVARKIAEDVKNDLEWIALN